MQPLFEQLWVISHGKQSDQLERFFHMLDSINWPFPKPQVFLGTDHDKIKPPGYWRSSAKEYGMHRSHLNLLEKVIMEDISSVLIMEDSVELVSDFKIKMESFCNSIPENWECMMLSGQGNTSVSQEFQPLRLSSSKGIRLSQCYGLNGIRPMRELYTLWADAKVDGNFLLDPFLRITCTYAPNPFLAEQMYSKNWDENIDPDNLRRSLSGKEPVIVLHAPRDVAEELEHRGWYSGSNKDQQTGFDLTLTEIFTKTARDHRARIRELNKWITDRQLEIVSLEDAVCTMRHPEIDIKMIRSLIHGQVYEVIANSVDAALSQVPVFPAIELSF